MQETYTGKNEEKNFDKIDNFFLKMIFLLKFAEIQL